eukprot:8030550-Pyramimonas_sp.AAC.2
MGARWVYCGSCSMGVWHGCSGVLGLWYIPLHPYGCTMGARWVYWGCSMGIRDGCTGAVVWARTGAQLVYWASGIGCAWLVYCYSWAFGIIPIPSSI